MLGSTVEASWLTVIAVVKPHCASWQSTACTNCICWLQSIQLQALKEAAKQHLAHVLEQQAGREAGATDSYQIGSIDTRWLRQKLETAIGVMQTGLVERDTEVSSKWGSCAAALAVLQSHQPWYTLNPIMPETTHCRTPTPAHMFAMPGNLTPAAFESTQLMQWLYCKSLDWLGIGRNNQPAIATIVV